MQQIEAELRQADTGLSEYELIKRLQEEDRFQGWISEDPTLALFQKHFAVMHVLYRLQQRLLDDGQRLEISPLLIKLVPVRPSDSSELSAESGELRQFYLDWSHFANATPDTVIELLTSFWRRYAAVDKRQEALQTLGLPSEASWDQVQVQYRRLAAENHPDRGGDSGSFRRVREAYEILKGSNG